MTKELLYTIFLPSLIFEAAFHLDFTKFIKNSLAIHALAVPGVVAAIALTAIILTPVATDPIAVVGLFKSLGAPKRLSILVEGESLVNDGTAIVFFTLIIGIVTGGSYTYGGIVLDFIKVVGLGMLIGFEVTTTILFSSWKPIVAAFFAVLIARALVVFMVLAILRPRRERIGQEALDKLLAQLNTKLIGLEEGMACSPLKPPPSLARGTSKNRLFSG